MMGAQYKLLSLLAIIGYVACDENADDLFEAPLGQGQLIFTHIIFRHGDRTIIDPYPNDPWKDRKYWPEGYGQLTNVGKQQHYELGKMFRQRYQSLLVDDKFSIDTVYVQSTDVDRTLMSVESNLAGFFPPHDEQLWNEEIAWQPIPVHTIPEADDYVLAGKKRCPRYDYAYQKYTESPAYVKIMSKYRELFKYIEQNSGKTIRTIQDAQNFYNTLWIENLKNRTLPEWASTIFVPDGDLDWLSRFSFEAPTNTPELARLKTGFLLRQILDRCEAKIKSALSPNRSIWVYSAHDTTIGNVLNSLGLFEPHSPPYASTILIELYKTASDHYLQVFYKNTTDTNPKALNIPNCGSKCQLKRFADIYKAILPTGDFETECRLSIMSMTYTDADFSRFENGLISLFVFTIMTALIGVLSCKFCERETSRSRYHRI